MKPRHSILPLAVMAIGTAGCFETQRDETFADTVVHDDTEIRMLHASPDAPRLDLLLDGERKLEDLDYGQARTMTPPADWYDVVVEGRTGPETLQSLLSPEFDRFDEDRRYDLLLAGSVSEEENTLRAVLLARDEEEPEDAGEEDEDEDEEEEEDESFSLRGVNLAESAGELNVWINDGTFLGTALTTLDYGEASGTLEMDEAVLRIGLEETDGQEIIFDSGRRERFSAGEDLLLVVVPNTSVPSGEAGGSPVKVLILNEDRVTTVRNQAEQSSMRLVHAAAESGSLDVEIGKESEAAVFAENGLGYTGVAPSSEPGGYALLDSEAFVVEAMENGTDDSVTRDIRFRRGHGRTLIALNDAESDLDLKSVQNNDRSVATNARVRVFNGSRHLNEAGPIDVYLLSEGQGLADDEGVIEGPVFTSLNFRKMSRYEPLPDGDYDLVVTRAGDTEQDLLRETITVDSGGIYDLVLAGDGNDTGDGAFQLIRIGGVPGS